MLEEQPAITNDGVSPATNGDGATEAARNAEGMVVLWDAPVMNTRYVQQYGWQQQQPPEDLSYIPDYDMPSILQKILDWSLLRLGNTDVNHIAAHDTTQSQTQTSEVIEVAVIIDPSPSDPDNLTLASNECSESSRTTTRHSSALVNKLSTLFDKLHSEHLSSTTSFATCTVEKCEKSEPDKVLHSEAKPTMLGECVSCYDEFPHADLTELLCSHHYCKPCLRNLVINAMKTESAFPPKCCLIEISLPKILQCLDSKQRTEYKEKAAEYSIPAAHRWYCPNTDCTKWIQPKKLHRDRSKRQSCPHCKTAICSTCRGLAHDEIADCPQDFGLEATLEIAEHEGWRRCYSCRTMVELTHGCRHITCKCGAEFCYVCCAKWYTCSCTETDRINRMEDLARRRAERDTVAQEEADEIARAIAEVEAFEREEERQREEEERLRQVEEEEMLAVLEAARLAEETLKAAAFRKAEQELMEALNLSIHAEWQSVNDFLQRVIAFQQASLVRRHEQAQITRDQKYQDNKELQGKEGEAMVQVMRDNIRKRIERLEKRQVTETEFLNVRLEDEEDAMFLQIQRHLRGKVNSEAREKRIHNEFHKLQEEQRQQLSAQQALALKTLRNNTSVELEGVHRAAQYKLHELRTEKKRSTRQLGLRAGQDKKWFEIVTERRVNLLAEHRIIMLRQTEAGEEPVGLTESDLKNVLPVLPDIDDGAPGPSGSQRQSHSTTIPEDADMYASTAVPSTKLRPGAIEESSQELGSTHDSFRVAARASVPAHPQGMPPSPPLSVSLLTTHDGILNRNRMSNVSTLSTNTHEDNMCTQLHPPTPRPGRDTLLHRSIARKDVSSPTSRGKVEPSTMADGLAMAFLAPLPSSSVNPPKQAAVVDTYGIFSDLVTPGMNHKKSRRLFGGKRWIADKF